MPYRNANDRIVQQCFAEMASDAVWPFSQERRVDPADGLTYTWDEIVDAWTWYRGIAGWAAAVFAPCNIGGHANEMTGQGRDGKN